MDIWINTQLVANIMMHCCPAGDLADTASKLSPLPPPPRLLLLPNKQQVKQLIAEAMDLQQEQLFAAACADTDTLDPPGRKSGSSNGGGSGRGGSLSGGSLRASLAGGRWNA
jgi:hypothetical protein